MDGRFIFERYSPHIPVEADSAVNLGVQSYLLRVCDVLHSAKTKADYRYRRASNQER